MMVSALRPVRWGVAGFNSGLTRKNKKKQADVGKRVEH